MSDYQVLSSFEDLDANSENEIAYNTTEYVGASTGGSGGYKSLAEMKKLASGLKSSGGSYLKSLLARSSKGGGESYNNSLMGDGGYNNSLMGGGGGGYYNNLAGGSGYKPAGYQRGYYSSSYSSSSYTSEPQNSTPNKRPSPPKGPRTAQIQSSNGQTRSVLPMDASGYMHDRLHEDTVKYMEQERAARYQVEIGARLTRRGASFDTKQIKKAYVDKYRSDQDKYAAPGQAILGAGTMSKDDMRRWSRESLIWVCASTGAGAKPIFYSGVGKLNKIHHSSFTGGAAVIGAGEWIVESGKLLYVSANSGHYRPTIDSLYAAVLHMSQAFLPETKVLMWDTKAGIYVHRRIKEFISAPSYNGLYKVHKDG